LFALEIQASAHETSGLHAWETLLSVGLTGGQRATVPFNNRCFGSSDKLCAIGGAQESSKGFDRSNRQDKCDFNSPVLAGIHGKKIGGTFRSGSSNFSDRYQLAGSKPI